MGQSVIFDNKGAATNNLIESVRQEIKDVLTLMNVNMKSGPEVAAWVAENETLQIILRTAVELQPFATIPEIYEVIDDGTIEKL